MTARKKWRIVAGFLYDEFPSERSAYDRVDALYNDWLDGASIGSLTVQVDDGSGWRSIEHIDFKEGQ